MILKFDWRKGVPPHKHIVINILLDNSLKKLKKFVLVYLFYSVFNLSEKKTIQTKKHILFDF